VTHVYDAFNKLWTKYISVEGMPDGHQDDGHRGALSTLKLLAAQAVIDNGLCYEEDDRKGKEKDKKVRVPEEVCWLLAGLHERQLSNQRSLAIRIEIGGSTLLDEEEQEVGQHRNDEESNTEDKFYGRDEKRSWRYTHLTFKPHSQTPFCQYDITAPQNQSQDVNPFSLKIKQALCTSDPWRCGEAKPQAWSFSSGSAGGTFTLHISESLVVSSKDTNNPGSSGPMAWHNVLQVRDAACTLFKCVAEESQSKVWQKDSFSVRIVMSGTPAELDLCNQELKKDILACSDKLTTDLAIKAHQYEARCWFDVQSTEEKGFDMGFLQKAMRAVVRGTAWLNLKLDLPRISEEQQECEVNRLKHLLNQKAQQTGNEGQAPTRPSFLSRLFRRMQDSKGKKGVSLKQRMLWEAVGGGEYLCILKIDKQQHIEPSLSLRWPSSRSKKKHQQEREKEKKKKPKNKKRQGKTQDKPDQCWKIELGCLHCGRILSYRDSSSTWDPVVGDLLCPLHKAILLSEEHSPYPFTTMATERSLRGVLHLECFSLPAMFEPPTTLTRGLIDPGIFEPMFDGLKCGYILSRSCTWPEKSINEQLFE